MSGPTPGPWVAVAIEDVEYVMVAGTNWLIAEVGTLAPKANARLMAAAPELLAALKTIYAYTLPASHFFEGTPEFAAARIAIAKAEGR